MCYLMRVLMISILFLCLLISPASAETARIWANVASVPAGTNILFRTEITDPAQRAFYTVHVLLDGDENRVVSTLRLPTDNFFYMAPGGTYTTITARIDRIGKGGYWEGSLENIASTRVTINSAVPSGTPVPGSAQSNRNVLQDTFFQFASLVPYILILLVFSAMGNNGDSKRRQKHEDVFTKAASIKRSVKKLRGRR
jgi:hypothetical protein